MFEERTARTRVIDPVLFVAVAFVAGGLVPCARAAAIAAAISVTLLVRARLGRWAIAAAAAAFALQAARAELSLRAAAAVHTRAAHDLSPPARCEGVAEVIASPTVRRAREPPSPRGAAPEVRAEARIDVEIAEPRCDGRLLSAPLRARLHGASEDLVRGDRVELFADLAAVHLFLNEGQPDPYVHIARSGIAATGGVVDARLVARGSGPGALIDRFRAHVRRRIEATFHREAAPLARALVLGETDLDEEDAAAFRTSGLSHLLAVSGTHLVLAVLGVAAALRAVLVRIEALAARLDVGRLVAAASIPAAWLYADFAGGGGSAMRAAFMLCAAMTARALARRPCAVRAFAVSLLGGAVEPLCARDLSFALSAAATAGLLLLGSTLSGALGRGPPPIRTLGKAAATTLAAMAGCAPLVAVVSPGLPLLGVAANVVAAPIGEMAALPLCLAHAVLAWAPPIEHGAAIVGSGALLAVRALARITAQASYATWELAPPTDMQLAALASASAALWVARDAAGRVCTAVLGVCAWLLLEVHATRQGRPEGRLRVTVSDVGQGDSLLVDLPDGTAMLIDGGGFVGTPVDPGRRVLLPLLRARRRDRIDVVVLSHPHPDHFGGLVSTTAALSVGELWDNGQGEAEGAGPVYRGWLSAMRSRGVTIRGPRELCGSRRIGGATVEVLAPCPSFVPDLAANDNSFVLRISHGRRSALLVGDAERHEEAELLARDGSRLQADLLKVGHHGSRTSTTPAFLERVRPSLAVISCGVRNRFGHPHPDALGTLARAGVPTLRTDRGGAVIWETDGEQVTISRP
jgi:competence protein ComEC